MKKVWLGVFVLILPMSTYAQIGINVRTPIGHSSGLNYASFSPDGKLVATASDDNSVIIWSVSSGISIMRLTAHEDDINCLDFSPDGKRLISASSDNLAIIWEVETGRKLGRLRRHNGSVGTCRFSHDGKLIATASSDQIIRIWRADNYDLVTKLPGHTLPVNSVEFSTDDSKIVSSSEDKTVMIWSVRDRKLIERRQVGRWIVNDACYSPDGSKLAIASDDKSIHVWDEERKRRIYRLKRHDWPVLCVEFSSNGRFLVTSSWDKKVIIWEVSTGKIHSILYGHQDWVNSVQFSADGRYVVSSSEDRTAIIWHVGTGKILKKLSGNTQAVYSAHFSSDGAYYAANFYEVPPIIWSVKDACTVSCRNATYLSFTPSEQDVFSVFGRDTLTVWDFESGKTKFEINGHDKPIVSACFSPSGNYILTTSYDKTAIVWNATSGDEVQKFRGHKKKVTAGYFSKDEKKVATISDDKRIIIWNLESGKQLASLKYDWKTISFESADFSRDGSQIVTTGTIFETKATVWNTYTGEVVRELKGHLYDVDGAKYSPDGGIIVTTSKDWTAILWNAQTGEKIHHLKGHDDDILSASFSQDGEQLVTVSSDNAAMIWDVASGRLLNKLVGHLGRVSSSDFSNDGRCIMTGSVDGGIIIWDVQTGEQISRQFVFRNHDYLTLLPSGYYKSTKGATKELYYIGPNNEIITFDQLDVKYNRPDKVLRALGNTDTALIAAYEHAYEKRIQRLGVDTTAFTDGFSFPELDIANENDSDGKWLEIHLIGQDSSVSLDRFNVWVNESPLYGQKGFSLKGSGKHYLDTTLSIELSQGENQIEASITNTNGIESFRKPLYVNYNPPEPHEPRLYFIGIGIDRFSQSDYNLNYCVKDIRDLANGFDRLYEGRCTVDTLFNKDVTLENVRALKRKLCGTSVNDKVVITYSGHGLFSDSFDYYLSTYAIDFNHPEHGGLPYEILDELLDSIPARQKLMLLDACHSGEIDKENLAKNYVVTHNDPSEKDTVKGIKMFKKRQEPKLGLDNSFELMQELFLNVRKGTGATIISAATGTQVAFEKGGNGYLTKAILELLKEESSITVQTLKQEVGKRVAAYSNGLQQPTSRLETNVVDWEVW